MRPCGLETINILAEVKVQHPQDVSKYLFVSQFDISELDASLAKRLKLSKYERWSEGLWTRSALH